MFTDILKVIGFSVASTLIVEIVSYFLTYRTETYKVNLKKAKGLQEDINELDKSGLIYTAEGKKQRKNLKAQIVALSGTAKKSNWIHTALLGVIHIISFRLTSKLLGGKVTAVLPFNPIMFVKGLAYRGLAEGHARNECSYSLIYMLCSMAIRGPLVNFLGFKFPQTAPTMAEKLQEKTKNMEKKMMRGQ